MSTDPAHSLADVLQVPLKTSARRLNRTRGNLSCWQIDSAREFRKFLAGNRDDILDIVESGTFFTREEIAPLLDTTLPGMAEVAALMAIENLLAAEKYDHIVVDTAPFGHTLRLFELPGHFQKFLNFLEVASSRDSLLAQRFGGRLREQPHPFVERWQKAVTRVKNTFASGRAEVVLVTTPETFSLNESVRCLHSLEQSVPHMRATSIVLNRAVTISETCRRCRARLQMTRRAQIFLKRNFPKIPSLIGPHPGNPLLGVEMLKRFGEVVFGGRKARLEQEPPERRAANFTLFRAKWPVVDVPLSFTVGKGGVGKTTTTASLAFHTRSLEKKTPVTVCSTDPAPSLDDIFQKEIGDQRTAVLGDPGFSAIEADSVAEFHRWGRDMSERLQQQFSGESGGLHVDLTFEKEVFAALMDVVPPGVDELFAIFRILDLLQSREGKTLIDMAPTGHAIELLGMPEKILQWSRLLLKSLAAHRRLAIAQDVAVELASLGQRLRKLLDIMKDPGRSRVWAVMLPEPVPDKETQRLLGALDNLGISVESLFVNRVLLEKGGNCKRCERARRWQSATLQVLQRKYKKQSIYLLPDLPGEIAGEAALKRFTSALWQIQK